LGDDILVGGDGQDTLFGGWGSDVLSGVHGETPSDDGNGRDFLNGGGGDDTILAGQNDVVTSGDGADTLVLGDWITGGQPASIVDYHPQDDKIIVVWDDATTTAPHLEIAQDANQPQEARILLNGQDIARVSGAPDLDSDAIILIAHSQVLAGAASPALMALLQME
jgi:Ca2+-binding RTX toxin-like protein